MWYIIDLTTIPNQQIPDLKFYSEIEAINWINNNGNAVIYTIVYID